MDLTRIWYPNNSILPAHTALEIRQVYVWIISKDKMIAIVSKTEGTPHFPGGHPEEGETTIQTGIREVYEEIGLDISKHSSDLEFFGYYLIKTNEQEYLQVRFLLQLPLTSDAYPVFSNENSDELRPVSCAQWVKLEKLSEYIPWCKGLEEYENVLELISK